MVGRSQLRRRGRQWRRESEADREKRDGRSKNMNANLELSENLAFTRIL